MLYRDFERPFGITLGILPGEPLGLGLACNTFWGARGDCCRQDEGAEGRGSSV